MKIKIFFIIIPLLLIAAACNRENDIIPDVVVDFTLNINDPQFTDLHAIGGSIYVDSRTNNFGRYSAGYRENGIIVTRGADEFFAYDRTCPHDYSIGESVRVNIADSLFGIAICPVCRSKYELINFGQSEGPSRYPLKNYRTSFDGTYVRVWNNY